MASKNWWHIIGTVYGKSSEFNYGSYNTSGSRRNALERPEFPTKTTRHKHFWKQLPIPIPWPWFRQLVAFFRREGTDSITAYST